MTIWRRRETALELGPSEVEAMEIVWRRGGSTVRDVIREMGRALAYTTVMTTLDRLYRKGLLERRKRERAYVYVPRLTRQEWERKRAEALVAGFLGSRPAAGGALISCLVDAVGKQDEALLDELEKEIENRRAERGTKR
jgi:predicted transcriptional regulator